METVAMVLALSCPVNDYDCDTFPSQEYCVECCTAGEEYCKYLDTMIWLHPEKASYWIKRRSEAGKLLEAWNHLCQAHSYRSNAEDHYIETSCKDELEALRECIGEDAYNARTMPLPVPLWRFETAK